MNWVKSKDHGQSDEEFKLEALERMASTNLPKDFDPKSQRIDLLGMTSGTTENIFLTSFSIDLRIPLPISRAAPGIKGKLDWAYNIVLDKIKNILRYVYNYSTYLSYSFLYQLSQSLQSRTLIQTFFLRLF